ncbi:MAG: cysteine--tRNA ligase [Candidatus Delongbacteria bacterium]|nr:cysteine--tRNA ligase [Candidatus Delongbacteria bacterium]
MALSFYNSLSRSMDEFKPIRPGQVGFYTCGPTVYNFAHIGNFRAYIFEDLLRRYLKYKGYEVTQVMNLTDIDDKTIRGCREKGKTLAAFTQPFKEAFFQDLDTLNIERAEFYPAATDHIPDIIKLIRRLEANQVTYTSRGSIYFRIKAFTNYGRLSHLEARELKDGARIDSDEYDKEEARDFALWKAWTEEDGDVFWETELGKGRPGWHIECSAMSMKYLGETFDIHTGGIDNLFPHHENEIAQSEAATGQPFVHTWLHCAHLMVDGKKMSKSLGNFYTLRDLTAMGYDPLAIRYTLQSTHYRQPLNFTLDGITASLNTIQRIRDFVHNLNQISRPGSPLDRVQQRTQHMLNQFEAEMDNDLNISGALGKFFEYIKELNPSIVAGELSQLDAAVILNAVNRIDLILGVLRPVAALPQSDLTDSLIQLLIQVRQLARKTKNWEMSDMIRDRLKELSVVLEDRPDKTTYKLI